ncbi:ABC transporter substrate-binding protein [Streptomonospora nanhaiensis]|uniref:ABC-type glycerol-3-phosphate transport system substrate-binding protein n=1 Tax=Streptomonospora nanhaiensis TaxID=1323731 RepID=A0A853BNY8_9ACTN|nr:sugar ABC transporter substrate-binding protein [Streptomonospora nanhaiensis]NYI96231.1 ABC-type glycerol-3-phosphate transport system substrate-binding protein [Streptomonospora nanhaiensis]
MSGGTVRRRPGAALVAAGLATAVLVTGCAQGDPGEEPMRYLSLAWQTQSIEANRRLVEEWNREHPEAPVEYVQGSWDNVNDQLVTAFEGGDPPDIIHNESPTLTSFEYRNYLADLGDHLPADVRADIGDAAWDTVTIDGRVVGVPLLQEPQVLIANADILRESGVRVPTVEEPWTWDEFEQASRELTVPGERHAVAWPLSSPTNRVLNLALNFGGEFFRVAEDGAVTVEVGPEEREVLERIHRQLYTDRTADPQAVGMGGSDPLPAFFAGQYAMVQGGVYTRQQVVEQAPDGFDWVMLPPLVGDVPDQGATSQTLSVAADSPHEADAAAFVAFMAEPDNQVDLALGDWLTPTSQEALASPELTTEANEWDVAVHAAGSLRSAPYLQVPGFDEFKNRVSEPLLQEYFGDRISLDELARRMEEEGNAVMARYTTDEG